MDGVRRVLYRLPEVIKAIKKGWTIYIVEGEKDADALNKRFTAKKRRALATTNSGGAGKWTSDYGETLAGAKRVVIVADKGDAGRRHAAIVLASLVDRVKDVKVVEAKEGKDAADHLAAGLGVRDFVPVDIESDRRPVIHVRQELKEVLGEAITALEAHVAAAIYVRGNILVRITRGSTRRLRGITQPAGAPVITPLEKAALRELLDRAARWVSADGSKPALPPVWVVEGVAARGEWPLPPLIGIVEGYRTAQMALPDRPERTLQVEGIVVRVRLELGGNLPVLVLHASTSSLVRRPVGHGANIGVFVSRCQRSIGRGMPRVRTRGPAAHRTQ
jgi:hypothetical protein